MLAAAGVDGVREGIAGVFDWVLEDVTFFVELFGARAGEDAFSGALSALAAPETAGIGSVLEVGVAGWSSGAGGTNNGTLALAVESGLVPTEAFPPFK